MVIISFGAPKILMIKAELLRVLLITTDFAFITKKKTTYLHPVTGTYTSLDLSICFPTLLLDYDWKVHDDYVVVITSQFI